MKDELKIKKHEKLGDWTSRIANYWNFGEELRDMLRKIALESYNRGLNDAKKK